MAYNVKTIFDVKDFGAKGDGTTNDTAAIIAAIAVSAVIGGAVYFPATGSFYRVTSAITLPANTSLAGDFSTNDGAYNIGSVIQFQGANAGFIMGGASITIKNLVLGTNVSAGPHISQPTAGSSSGYWLFENVRCICGNPNKGVVVLGSGAADGYGVENNWSTFSRLDILAAGTQAVPLIQLYGQGGGLSNISFRDCVFTGGGLVGSGNESTAEFVHVESTDSGLLINMEFHNISFEIPVAGAIVFKSVSDSKITNCWAGDLTGHNPTAPVILVDQSSHTGALASRNILIDTLFSDIGSTTPGQETIKTGGNQGPVILQNSKIKAINNSGPGLLAIINLGSAIDAFVGDPPVGISDGGFIRSEVQQLAQGSIILHNDLNSDASPGTYTGFATVVSTAIRPILLGGLTLGAYGAGTEFTLFYNYSQPLTIVNEDGYSTAAYRITTTTGSNIVIGSPSIVKFIYDGLSSRWIVLNVFNAATGVSTVLNVKSFGAKGDNSTDDTTAIQNTINAAAVNGGTVFFPTGTYIISSTLNLASSVVLRGASRPKWNGPSTFQTGSWLKWGTPVTAGGTMISGISAKDVIIENLGINGAEGGTTTQIVNGLQIQGAAGAGNASYNVFVRDCIFIELDSCIIWGEGGVTGYQADTSSIERCEFYDWTKYGIHLQSINAFDASKISQCTGVGVGSGGFFIYVEKAGFLTIEDSDGGNIGGGGGGFVKINAATNPVTIKNCEVESSDYFLYVSGGSGDSSVINLYQCYTNNPIYIGTIARVVSIGTMITGTLTLDHPGAKWMGFGDRVIISLGGQVIINSGVFHNQDLTDAGQGSNSFHAAGQIIWAPDYWYGLSPGDGYGTNKVAAEKCIRSGTRGAYWQPNISYPTGNIIVPLINNGHVYYSGGGTSGPTEPTWPLGSGSTVVNGTITFTEFGPSALFEPFGALNQLSGFAPPQSGYYTEGAITFNTTPAVNNVFAWICTVSGNPGTWQALSIPDSNSVKAFGAVGDGAHNDATAIQNAINASSSKIIYFPVGTYKINSTINMDGYNITLRGEGIDLSIISAGTASMTMLQSNIYSKIITVEDLTIDLNTLGFFGLLPDGQFFERIMIRRCKFIGSGEFNSLFISNGADNIYIEDCIFDNEGKEISNGITVTGPCQNIVISGCTFRGLQQGIELEGLTNHSSINDVVIDTNNFDFMWYTSPVLDGYANSGGTVTYTSGTLVDTTKNFIVQAYGTAGAVAQYGYIRTLNSVATGNIAVGIATRLIASGSTFLSANISQGDIIRSAGAYAIIKSVDSDTVINIEEWLDVTTTQHVSPPIAGSAYTVYRIIVGRINTGSSHTINLYNGWHDLVGNPVTPANGTLYEIVPTPGYPITGTETAKCVRITGNTLKRSGTDQISPFGDQCEIAYNTIMDGQDLGITADGTEDGYGGKHSIHHNKIFKQGNGGIYIGQSDCLVHDNQIFGFGTCQNLLNSGFGIGANPAGTATMSSLQIHNNLIDGYGYPFANYGISIVFVQNSSVLDNTIRNMVTSEIFISGSSTANNIIRHFTDNITYGTSGGVAPGQILDVYGTSNPLGILSASPSSIYKDNIGGLLWLKTANTDTSGWQIVITEEWSPANISNGLQFYVRADMGKSLSGLDVTSWNDQSGTDDSNKNLRATVGHYPTFVASDSNFNNQPTIKFDPSISSQYFQSGLWNTPSPSGSTWMWILQPRVSGLMIAQTGIEAAHRQSMFANSSSFTAISGNTTELDSRFSLYLHKRIVIGVFNGTSSSIYVSESAPENGTVDTSTLTGVTLGIYYDIINFPFDGNIADVASWNRVLTASEIKLLNNYASTRYNINIDSGS